jgi:hypothetical protein
VRVVGLMLVEPRSHDPAGLPFLAIVLVLMTLSSRRATLTGRRVESL